MEKRAYESPAVKVVGELVNDTQATHVGVIYDGGPLPAPQQTLAQVGGAS